MVIWRGFAAVQRNPVEPGAPAASVRWKTSSRLLAAQLGPSSPGPARQHLLAGAVGLDDADPPSVGRAG